jgi:hypothetical protein
MSLTRKEWEQMWESVKCIERNACSLESTNFIRMQRIMNEVRFIKDKIQQVIGQME